LAARGGLSVAASGLILVVVVACWLDPVSELSPVAAGDGWRELIGAWPAGSPRDGTETLPMARLAGQGSESVRPGCAKGTNRQSGREFVRFVRVEGHNGTTDVQPHWIVHISTPTGERGAEHTHPSLNAVPERPHHSAIHTPAITKIRHDPSVHAIDTQAERPGMRIVANSAT
jgi:hypothetical protein